MYIYIYIYIYLYICICIYIIYILYIYIVFLTGENGEKSPPPVKSLLIPPPYLEKFPPRRLPSKTAFLAVVIALATFFF